MVMWTATKRDYDTAGRVSTSDWSTNSFVLVVYENIFKVQSEFSAQFFRGSSIDNQKQLIL